MTEDDISVKHSPLCQSLTQNRKTVQVEIYEDGEGGWLLEVVDDYGNSTVWDQSFASDQEALDEALRTIEEDGIESLIGISEDTSKDVESDGANSMRMMVPLSAEELEELDDFLLSDAVSDESMTIDSLDGYLTAIVIAPTALRMDDWLPGVWGTETDDAPEFETMGQAQHIMELILRLMNSISISLGNDPDAFEPIFDIGFYDGIDNEFIDAEMWSYGFLQGLALCRHDWKAFLADPIACKSLDPMRLLGADDVTPEEDALTKTPEQRESIAKQIPAAIASIYRYWLPYRKAAHERQVALTYQRDQPKIGRNDACPCGSGKKFKKCCGAASLLH